ncbi:2Fe-2S iron-sulfur cluster-binding protein [Paenibacillus sp. JTLBN-2024]
MSKQTVSIALNGQQVEVKEGMTVLEAINLAGLSHPQICYVPEVDPIQTCDTCIVEINGRLKRACSTKAEDGMDVRLSSERAKRSAKPKRWTASSKTICCTARCATTTTATASCTTRRK